jgi:hypothetical protein
VSSIPNAQNQDFIAKTYLIYELDDYSGQLTYDYSGNNDKHLYNSWRISSDPIPSETFDQEFENDDGSYTYALYQAEILKTTGSPPTPLITQYRNGTSDVNLNVNPSDYFLIPIRTQKIIDIDTIDEFNTRYPTASASLI